MSTTAEFVNFYELLNVSQNATEEQIKEAIKTQRRTWVKRQQSPNKNKQREAEDRVRQIDEAQKTLLDQASRKSFDQKLANHRPAAADTGPSASGSQDWVERAREFLAQGNALSAAYAARQATEQNGANHEAWAIRAHANSLTNRPQDALFEFNEAIRLKPDAHEYHFDLGSFHEGRRDWVNALSSYQTAANLAPDVPMYRVAVASVYLNNDLAEKALPIMEAVHSEHPDVPAFSFYLAWALNDAALDHWSQLKGGGQIITAPEQITASREMFLRARDLKFVDDELRALIDSNLAKCDDAEKLKFRLPGFGAVVGSASEGCSAALFTLAVVIAFWMIPFIVIANSPALGILLLGVWGFGFYKLAFQPGWKRQRKDAAGMLVK